MCTVSSINLSDISYLYVEWITVSVPRLILVIMVLSFFKY